MPSAWSSVSFLDALQPEPGYTVDHAMFSTYSADLVVVVAAMLALSGFDNDHGSGSKVDFANAFRFAKDRLRILVQNGRISVPHQRKPVLAIMDHFIREIHADERERSWHPKTGLVKYVSDDDGDIHWRLWISSRNLTRDMSMDVGLLVTGKPSEPGVGDPGINQMGQMLAEYAQLPGVDGPALGVELDSVRWEFPHGIRLQEFLWMSPENEGRGLRNSGQDISKLVVVSPFLDAHAVHELGRWGESEKTERILVSTASELARLAGYATKPLEAFGRNVFFYEMPLNDVAEVSGDSQTFEDKEPDEDELPDAFGLHAKLIYMKHSGGNELWLGSANATQRAWVRNYEAVVRLQISSDISSGVMALVDNARLFDSTDIVGLAEPSEEEEFLDNYRKALVAGWELTQELTPKGPHLVAVNMPPVLKGVEIEIGLLGCALVAWPRGKHRITLPPVLKSQETELVHVKLLLGYFCCEWIQRAPLDPPPDDQRDRHLLAQFLDARTFLSWIRSLLVDGGFDNGGGGWDEEGQASRRGKAGSATALMAFAPTLEDILKSWSREPAKLVRVNTLLQEYMDLIESKEGNTGADEQIILDEFRETWNLIKHELVPDS